MSKKFKKINKMLKFKTPIFMLSVFWGIAVLMFALTFSALGAWDPPTANPPSANAPTPINVTGTTQYKAGAFGIGGIFATDTDTNLSVTGGGVTIGDSYSILTPPAEGLISEGPIGIGTPTPITNLHVVASGLILQSVPSADIGFEAGGTLDIGSWAGLPGAPVFTSLCTINTAGDLACVGSVTGSGSGISMAGVSGDTIRHNGTDWVSNNFLYNDGASIGIGTATPGTRLDVSGDTRTNQLLFGGGNVAYGVPSGYTLGMYANDGAFFVPVNTGNIDSDLRLYITDDAGDRFSIFIPFFILSSKIRRAIWLSSLSCIALAIGRAPN